VEDFDEFLKNSARVVLAIETFPELLKAAAVKGHVAVSRELLETGVFMKVSRKQV
jgi:hypothetical protein